MTFDENSKFFRNAKMILDAYVNKGGKVNDLAKGNKIYDYIAQGKAYDKDGNVLNIETKFVYLGHPRTLSFFDKAKRLLDAYVENGGDVNQLSSVDKIYRFIQCSKVYDENGNLLDLETKFKLSGHERKPKCTKDVRENLIEQIEAYLENNGSFHIERKKLPFSMALQTYSNALKRKGIILTHEQIMKDDLGYRQYSDVYYRCINLSKVKDYRDEYGYVDSIRQNKTFTDYITHVGITFGIPYYLIITLLLDEKMTSYAVQLDKVKYTETLLKQYLLNNDSLVNLKEKDKYVFDALDYLTRYYSDGSELRFNKNDWLNIFGLSDVKHNFRDVKQNNLDISEIENIMTELKLCFQNEMIPLKSLDKDVYKKLLKLAIQKNISIKELLQSYGLNCRSSCASRLSRAWIKEVPFIQEMKEARDKVMEAFKYAHLQKLTERTGKDFQSEKLCKEELFEIKLRAVQSVYLDYKDRLESYTPTNDCEIIDIYTTSED